jgi:sulfite reductase beta subunit-like hemoprotein
MTESMAYRMLTKRMSDEQARLALQAQDTGDALTRFAQDVSAGRVDAPGLRQIVEQVRQIADSAVRLTATREAVELYETERDIDAGRATEE